MEVEGKKDAECYNLDEIRSRFGHFPSIAQEVYVYAIPVQKRMILTAPELLVVCFRMPKPVTECRVLYDLNCLASAWCCIENILLAMAGEGLYGVTYLPQNNSALHAVLNIPEGREIAAIIPFGYPAANAIRMKQDTPILDDRLHIDRFC